MMSIVQDDRWRHPYQGHLGFPVVTKWKCVVHLYSLVLAIVVMSHQPYITQPLDNAASVTRIRSHGRKSLSCVEAHPCWTWHIWAYFGYLNSLQPKVKLTLHIMGRGKLLPLNNGLYCPSLITFQFCVLVIKYADQERPFGLHWLLDTVLPLIYKVTFFSAYWEHCSQSLALLLITTMLYSHRKRLLLCSEWNSVQEECHSASTPPCPLSTQRPRCAPSFLLTDCPSTFSALVEQTCTARRSLVKKNPRTHSGRKDKHWQARARGYMSAVFQRSPYVHRSPTNAEHTLVYTLSMKNTEYMHSSQISDVVSPSL